MCAYLPAARRGGWLGIVDLQDPHQLMDSYPRPITTDHDLPAPTWQIASFKRLGPRARPLPFAVSRLFVFETIRSRVWEDLCPFVARSLFLFTFRWCLWIVRRRFSHYVSQEHALTTADCYYVTWLYYFINYFWFSYFGVILNRNRFIWIN